MPDNRRPASSVRGMIVIGFAFVWNSIVTKSGAVVIPEALPVESRATCPAPELLDGRDARPSTEYLIRRVTVLQLRLGRDWESPPVAERLGGDLDSGRRLLPLVFAALNHPYDPPH